MCLRFFHCGNYTVKEIFYCFSNFMSTNECLQLTEQSNEKTTFKIYLFISVKEIFNKMNCEMKFLIKL